jgi:hypothetical protein
LDGVHAIDWALTPLKMKTLKRKREPEDITNFRRVRIYPSQSGPSVALWMEMKREIKRLFGDEVKWLWEIFNTHEDE